MKLNTADMSSNLDAFIKVRLSLEPVDVVCYFVGNVYAYLPGQQAKHLFVLEGYNIGRAVKVEGGYDLLTREAVFYKDPVTTEIIDHFDNPLTGERNEVLHIWNDPVNQQLRLDGPRAFGNVPVVIGDSVHLNADVFLTYPSALPTAKWPRESGSDTYQGAEIFRFISDRSDIENDSPSAPCHISWVRLGAWLPWMLMGSTPGNLVYHTGGAKLASYAALPADIRAKVEANHPEYAFAPTSVTGPNETSWTYYAKVRKPVA